MKRTKSLEGSKMQFKVNLEFCMLIYYFDLRLG